MSVTTASTIMVTIAGTVAATIGTPVITNNSSDHDTVGENTTEIPTFSTSTDRNSTTAMPTASTPASTSTATTTSTKAITTSKPATIARTVTITSDSIDYDTMGENTTELPTSPTSTDHTSTTAMPTSSNRDMLWVYLLMAGVVIALVLLFMVCFIIFYCRYRSLQKRGKTMIVTLNGHHHPYCVF